MVERGGTEPGHRPRPQDRTGEPGLRIQTYHEAHHRGEYPEASGDEAGSGGYRGDGRNRSAQQYHERRPHSYAGRRYISDMPVSDGHTVPVSARRRRERLKRHKKIDRKLQSIFGGSMVAYRRKRRKEK